MPSAVIRYFRYDEAAQTLRVVFQSGRRYCYLRVPAAVAQAMRAAYSKGEFFNKHIRGRFDFEEEPASTAD